MRSFIIAVALVAPASADTISLNPVADAFVTSALPANNYGGGGGLAVAAAGLPQGEFQSVMRFDASSALTAFNATYGAGNWTIQSVFLQLTATLPNNPIFNTQAAGQLAAGWMLNDSWVEGTGTPAAPSTTGITFATLPSFLSGSDESIGAFAFNGATSGAGTYNLSLTPGFTSDLTAGGLVSLRLSAANSSIAYVFNSRSFGTTSARPALSITAIPAPGAAIPLLILPLLCRRR